MVPLVIFSFLFIRLLSGVEAQGKLLLIDFACVAD